MAIPWAIFFLHFHPKQALFGLAVVLAAFQKNWAIFSQIWSPWC
jgi:hypothetical protein